MSLDPNTNYVPLLVRQLT